MDITKMRNRLQEKRDQVSMSKEETSSMYNNIDKELLMETAENADWYLKRDERNLSETEMMIESFYGATALAGSTDYKDHRNDTVEQLKEKTLESLKTRVMQKGHYYDKDGNLFDGVMLVGKRGGWSAYCLFSGNDNLSYFQFMRS